MATPVIMPRQGQSVESCILGEIRKKKGDSVTPGEILFAYETDKAAFEQESPVAGTVLEVFFDEGDEVPVLVNVMVIGTPGESVAEFAAGTADGPGKGGEGSEGSKGSKGSEDSKDSKDSKGSEGSEGSKGSEGGSDAADPTVSTTSTATVIPTASLTPATPTTPVSAVTAPTSSSAGAVSPRAQALAEKHAINSAALIGSGPEGRIIERDVRAAIEASPTTTPLARESMRHGMASPATGSGLAGMVRSGDLVADNSKPTVPGTPPKEDSTIVPLTNMRRLIARAMHASLQNSAQLTHHLAADARRILELRKRAKADVRTSAQAPTHTSAQSLTINDLVCWSVVRALEKFPNVNAHFLGEKEGIRRFAGVHLALAVDTERGLMVPVVRNADKMTAAQLAANLKQVAEACKKGSINPDLLASEAASFTVSNLGGYGVEMFTPIINLPQVAILGVNTIVPRPKELGDGVYGFVPHIGLSLTYDHRAIDGGEATRFLRQIAIEIENIDIQL